jgi:hypothetical protein
VSVSIGGKVADFARANRLSRLREPSSVEHGRVESYPLPIRRGGTSDMSSSIEHPEPDPPAAQGKPKPKAAGDRPVRPIPTPGDLFPRGVRHSDAQDEELATGTG